MKYSPVLSSPEDQPVTEPPPRASLITRMLPRIVLLLVMGLSAWLGFAQFTSPPVVPRTATGRFHAAPRDWLDPTIVVKSYTFTIR